jgi:hypothetical protein
VDYIQSSNKQVDKFGPGAHGFSAGNPTGGEPATFYTPDWSDAVQQEHINAIKAGGLVPSGASLSQVAQSIRRIAGGNMTVVNVANSPYALTADNAGLVIMDATAGNIAATLPAVNVVTALPVTFNFVRIDATGNTAAVSRAGADTFIGGSTGFTLLGQGDTRSIKGDTTSKWLTVASNTGRSPGDIFLHAGTTAPAGSLVCPTSVTNVSRTTYARLFAAIGTTWGVGDGATTFGIPWLPADYSLLQANSNVGTQSVGAVIAHVHTTGVNSMAGNNGGTGPGTSEIPSPGTVTSTGGAANYAAGARVLMCVQF